MKFMRIWFACSFGMLLCMVFGWDYGFFAIIVPVFVLNLSEERKIAGVVIAALAGIVTSIEATFIVDLLQSFPVLMFIVVALSMLLKCIAMMQQRTFLFGFASLLIGSIIYNLASYSAFDITDFNANLWVVLIASIVIYVLSYWVFPNKSIPSASAQAPIKSHEEKVKQVLMGWSVSVAVFVFFQVHDLFDSLSALISILVILVPMTLTGARDMGKIRVIGTLMGCCAGLIVHMILGKWFSNPLLFLLGFTIVSGLLSVLFSRGPIASGIGFSAIASIAVPFTTNVVPQQQDAVYSILYRLSSIFFAVLVAITVMFLLQKIIDKFVDETAFKAQRPNSQTP